MKIKIYAISKKQNEIFSYKKECRGFGVDLEIIYRLNAKILNAQKISPNKAKEAYADEFNKFINKDSANFALDSGGKKLDSMQFAELLRDKNEINFFIGGAFGFGREFLDKVQSISLGNLTFSHELARMILCEQIYRGLCINNNHPYHKE